MISIKSFGYWRIFQIFIFTGAVILAPFVGIAAENEKKAPAKPVTTNNLDISIAELGYRLKPLTKDDLSIEADGWLQVIKKHSQKLSDTQIAALKAENDEKTKLLESVTQLDERQTALADRLKAVIEEFKRKGGKVDDYQAYIGSISGIDLRVGALRTNWALVSGWLTSAEGGLRWIKQFVLFVVIVVFAWMLAVLIGKAVKKAVVRIEGASALLKDFIVNITRKLIFIVGFVVALSMLGIVSTTLMTLDNQKVVVPNNMIWGDKITNATGSDKRRVDMVFGIGYSDDIAKAQKILEEILVKHAAVLKDPEPVVKVHELADSSVNFVVRPWVETENYWDVYWDITRTVKERFDAEGVSIPFPQRDVHMHQVTTN
jgi:small conductance mechanosensitive channel